MNNAGFNQSWAKLHTYCVQERVNEYFDALQVIVEILSIVLIADNILRMLRDPKPLVVGIAWVVECVEQRKRVDESKFLVDVEDMHYGTGTGKVYISLYTHPLRHVLTYLVLSVDDRCYQDHCPAECLFLQIQNEKTVMQINQWMGPHRVSKHVSLATKRC